MVNAMNPQFSVLQAIDFCKVFQTPTLFHDGKFQQSQLKILSGDERRICLEALEKISTSQLSEWNSNSAQVSHDPEKLDAIAKKIKQLPVDEPESPIPWYQAPFVWIAEKVHSFFLWFQNAFMGRITSKHLLDQVAIFCQNASTAKSDVDSIEKEILPEVNKKIDERIEERDEVIIKGNLANGLLEIYKILLALKSEGKREHIMQKAIAYSTIEEIESLPSKPFFVIVRDLLKPYFESNKEKSITEEEFKTLALSFEVAKTKPDSENLKVLQSNYSHVMSELGPVLLSKKAKKVTEILGSLYEAAGKAIQLDQDCKDAVQTLKQAQSKAEELPQDVSDAAAIFDDSSEEIPLEAAKEEKTKSQDLQGLIAKLGKELKEQDSHIQSKFDSIFKDIEEEIDEEGKKLYKNKYGSSPELNADNSRLQLDRLKEYGLKSLVFHQGQLLEKAELLKKKYLS